MAVLLVLIAIACAVAVYRTRIAALEREAEQQWRTEEGPWWAELREG